MKYPTKRSFLRQINHAILEGHTANVFLTVWIGFKSDDWRVLRRRSRFQAAVNESCTCATSGHSRIQVVNFMIHVYWNLSQGQRTNQSLKLLDGGFEIGPRIATSISTSRPIPSKLATASRRTSIETTARFSVTNHQRRPRMVCLATSTG